MLTLLIIVGCLVIGTLAGRAYETGARASRDHPMWVARARLAAEFGTDDPTEWAAALHGSPPTLHIVGGTDERV
jgi:hypothetical protein